MKLAAYTRVSTDKQAESGFGLAVQKHTIAAWAASNGHKITAWHEDAGESGSDGLDKRTGLADALHDCATRTARGVVVARLDRLARDLVLQETLIGEARRHDARVYSCAAGEDAYLEDDPADPSRKLIRQILGAVAEYERRMITLRTQAGVARKKAAGGHHAGQPAYGWHAVAGKLERVDHEQAQIALMVTMRQGGASYRDIARILNETGAPTKFTAHHWEPGVVRRIVLRNLPREETTTGAVA